jgi:hypothetical protein
LARLAFLAIFRLHAFDPIRSHTPAARMKPGRRYFILEDPLPYADQPLGRVVVDKWRPMRDFAPCDPPAKGEPRHGLFDIKPDTKPNEHVYEDWERFVGHTSDWSIEAGLASLLGIKHSRESESGITLKSKELKTCNLTDTRRCFGDLMKNTLFSRDLTELVNQTKKSRLYFVVGYLTTKGGVWKEFISAKRSSRVDVTVPVLEAVGSPLPNNVGDPQVAPEVGNGERTEWSTKMEDDVIFALAYDVIKISYGFGSDRKAAARRRIEYGAPKLGKSHERVLAADDDTDSDEEDEDDYADDSEPLERVDAVLCDANTVDDHEEEDLDVDSIAFNLNDWHEESAPHQGGSKCTAS